MSLAQQKHFLVEQKNLDKDKPTLLYGDRVDVRALQKQLISVGFKAVDIIKEPLSNYHHQLIALPHFQTLVSAKWLYKCISSIDKSQLVAAPMHNTVIVEVGSDDKTGFIASHVKGALYVNTNDFESEPLWKVVPLRQLKEKIEALGITHDSTVILYSRFNLSAARIALILMYAGVKDVRLLDGDWNAWLAENLPVETGQARCVKTVDFGVTIPAYPEYMINLKKVQTMLKDRDNNSVVSVRSWNEYTGDVSGYSYVKPKGRIAGAKWGQGGHNANSLDFFKNPDGTLRSADEIENKWKQSNILAQQQVCFYCGTCWRASEIFMYAYTMGWKNISVFDGGWYEWSMGQYKTYRDRNPSRLYA